MSNEQPRQSIVAPGSSEDSAPAANLPVPQPTQPGQGEPAQTVPAAPQTATESQQGTGDSPQPALQPTDAPPQEQQR
jgi:hypothetical protein